MRIPWKKIGKGILKGIALGAALDGKEHSQLDLIASLIEGVEQALPASPGAEKKATVEAISDAALETAVGTGKISQEEATRVRALRGRYIDLYVQLRNLHAQTEAAWDELQATIAQIKAA